MTGKFTSTQNRKFAAILFADIAERFTFESEVTLFPLKDGEPSRTFSTFQLT